MIVYHPSSEQELIDSAAYYESNLEGLGEELNIDLSSTLEAAPKQALSGWHERQWKTENRTAVKAYNNFVEDNGCFSNEYRKL